MTGHLLIPLLMSYIRLSRYSCLCLCPARIAPICQDSAFGKANEGLRVKRAFVDEVDSGGFARPSGNFGYLLQMVVGP